MVLKESLKGDDQVRRKREGGRGVEDSEEWGSVKGVDAPWPSEGGRGADK